MKRTIKKSMSILLAFTLLFGSFAFGLSDVNWADFAVTAKAEDETETFTEGYYTYTVDENGNATITDVDTSISGDITIPETLGGYPLTGIAREAFDSCRKLTSVYIQKNIVNIGNNNVFSLEIFANCDNLTNITVDPANTEYLSDELGVLYNKDKTILIQYPSGSPNEQYVIPDGVRYCPSGAFENCKFITEAVVPESLTYIQNLFENCTKLKKITFNSILNGALSGSSTFSGCTSLEEFVIGKNCNWIPNSHFTDCVNFKKFIVEDGNMTFSTDENGVLYSFDKTNLIRVPTGNTLYEFTIPDGVVIIGNSSFANCYSLSNVIFSNSVKKIDCGAFYNCYGLTNIEIPENIVEIEASAFSRCLNLTNISLPDTAVNIGMDAFGWTGYYKDENNWENDVLYIGKHLIETKETISGSYQIKDGTLTIASSAFGFCDGLTNIEIPDSVISVGESAFYNTGYYNDESNWENDVLYIGKHLIGAKETISGSYQIKDGTLTIADQAFSSCDSLTSVTISNSVTDIGYRVFASCDSLTDIYYIGTEDEWNKITIGNYNEELYKATIHFNNGTIGEPVVTKPVETPTTTKPTTSSTTKPIETTKPTTEPTKPVEIPTTTKPVEATKPTTTKPESTTKPEPIEEEIIKKPSTSTVKYGETLILHADFDNVPADVKIEWSVEGDGVTIVPSEDGKTCAVTSTSTGDVTITAKYTDASGVEHVSEQEIKSNASFWQKIVSFFKNLFGISRIIEQVIKF